MRKISDVVESSNVDVSTDELMNYFKLDEISCNELKPLKVLYYFNISGFYIPIKPGNINNSLNTISGWIELAKAEKKLELHDNDGIISQVGDIAFSDEDIHIINNNEECHRFIRIPDYYLYTNIHLSVGKKKTYKINLTGEDIYMLEDSKNVNEISICDSHEDGA